jgi:TnpA family transposase
MGFAFCHLLGLQRLPRLENIKRQKLYRANKGELEKHDQLQVILTRPIQWKRIEQQYDEMIKPATALRLGTADAESILQRFTCQNVQHPTYRAPLDIELSCLAFRWPLAVRLHWTTCATWPGPSCPNCCWTSRCWPSTG